jgi:hypothetical protein
VEQRQPFSGLAPGRRSAVACHIDLGGIKLVQEISPLDDGRDRVLGASAEVFELALTGAAGQRVDVTHHLVVIDGGGELGPGDAPLLDRVVEQRRNHGSVAMGGDGSRYPAGMVDAAAAQFGYTISEDPRREIVGISGGDHDGRTRRPAEQAAVIVARSCSMRLPAVRGEGVAVWPLGCLQASPAMLFLLVLTRSVCWHRPP